MTKRRVIWIGLSVLLIALVVYAQQKVSDLSAVTTLDGTELLLITKTSGAANTRSRKMTVTDFTTAMSVAFPNAAADGATKGLAGFIAADFNASSGIISLDYVNAQKATGSVPGFLSAADWTTFNTKLSSGGALGTPSSGTLTNATGYVFANLASKPTTLSGYGITDAVALTTNRIDQNNAATTSAQLRSVLSDELGNGAALFDGATPTGLVLTNATGLPLTTGVTGILLGANGGTGVANTGFTITLGGNLVTSGAFSTTITSTATTNSTLPAGTHSLAPLDSPSFTTPTLGVASATSLALTGTAGAGFGEFPTQSSPPAAPVTGYREYADSTGRRSWIRASDGFTRTWDATLTGNRVYGLFDASDTLVGLTVAQALTNKTINGNTFTAGSYTLTGTAGKTLSFTNSLTLSGTDGSTLNIGAGGTLGSRAFDSTAYAPIDSPLFTTLIQTPQLKIANGGFIYPSANATTAIRIGQADGTTAFVTFDSTNKRVGVNKTPGAFDLDVNGATNLSSSLATGGAITVKGNVVIDDAVVYHVSNSRIYFGSSGLNNQPTIRGATVWLNTGGTDRWEVDGSGHFIAIADNTYDIGASGATRPRDFFLGRNATIGGVTTLTGGLKGTTTNDNATALNIGEYASGTIAVGSAVTLSNATPANVTSVSLTAGDWQVWGIVDYVTVGATTTDFKSGISSTSATFGAQDTFQNLPLIGTALSDTIGHSVAPTRISLASTTTIYLIGQSNFSVGTATAYGSIFARRVR